MSALKARLFPEPWMRWYDLPGLRRIALARFSFMRKAWMPGHRRLARLRALYWVLLRGHDTEICNYCGGPVGLVFHAPDAIWETVTGYARHPSGEAAPGVLCIPCVDFLYARAAPRGEAGYLRWTCVTDDSIWPVRVRAALSSLSEGSQE